MNYYAYLEEMQMLCLKASNALKVIGKSDKLMADVYSAAEEGFFQKKMRCSVEEAKEFAGGQRTERLQEFRSQVAQWEEEAAYAIRDQSRRG